MGSQDHTAVLAAFLAGKKLHIPNLHDVFARWPSHLSPHHAELKDTINQKLNEWIKDPKTRLKAEKIDVPIFTSRWWPTSSVDAALCAAFYNLWLFIWDDALDGEDALLGAAETRRLHNQATAFIKHKLDLSSPSDNDHNPAAPSEATAAIFDFIGEHLRGDRYHEAGRKRFFREIEFYMRCCEVEQVHYDRGELPSIEEYWRQRRGTSSVYSSAALADFLAGVELPEELFDTAELKALWNEHNRNISIINDMMSLKKEINVGMYSSLIPITMHETGKDVDAIVQDLVVQVHESADKFDHAGAGLLAMVDGDAEMQESIKKYIEVLQTNMTGNFYWSLGTARYGVTKYVQEDGSLVIPL